MTVVPEIVPTTPTKSPMATFAEVGSETAHSAYVVVLRGVDGHRRVVFHVRDREVAISRRWPTVPPVA